MKLDEIGADSVYLDTNVLYMYLRADPKYLPVIKSFLTHVVRGDIVAFVSVLALDELFYRLLLARVQEARVGNPLEVLRRNLAEAIAAHVPVIEEAVRRLLTLPHMNLVGVETVDFDRMLENISAFSLLPRDALHVAIIQRLGLANVASDDTDFDRVKGLERHWVVNPPDPREPGERDRL